MKKAALIMMLAMLISTTAHAQKEAMYRVDVDRSGNTVNVSILFENDDEKCVKMLVLKPGNTFTDIDSADYNFNNGVCYADQIYSEEKLVKISFKPDDAVYGLYSGRFGVEGSSDFHFYYSDVNELKTALDALNSDDLDTVKTFMENGVEKIGVFGYSGLPESAKDKVARRVKEVSFQHGDSDSDIISAAADAKLFITGETAANMIMNADTAHEAQQLNELYGNELKLSTDGVFAALSDLDKESVYKTLTETDAASLDELRECFDKNTAYIAIAKLPYGYMEEALKAFESIDYTYYNLLNNKSNVLKGMSGKTYSDEASVKSAFESLALSEYNLQRKNSSSGGSSGGGGGGGGYSGPRASGGIILPTAEPTVSDNTTPADNTPNRDIFGDIANVGWARDAINGLYERGIISGRDERIFAPDDYVTRAEFAKMLVLSSDMTTDNAECGFLDVPTGAWYYDYVASAFVNNVVQGDNNLFNPDSFISREDIAVMLLRAAGAKGVTLGGGSDIADFDDADTVSDYAIEAVRTLKSAGIINGMEDNTFRPKSNATRAQAAVMLWAYIAALGK